VREVVSLTLLSGHVMAGSEQLVDECDAHEARPAHYQNLHWRGPSAPLLARPSGEGRRSRRHAGS
jgi:hypothetical protein